MGPKAIPDRWLNYYPIGKRIEGTRFIAFKVPLRKIINKNVSNDKRLDADILLERIPDLGIIIDLTSTYRYYEPELFTKHGIRHQKLMIPGHSIPTKPLVNEFRKHVFDFLKLNANNDKLIGVHCTHGVNRTGYLICHYLISEMKMSPKEAMSKFSAARGYKIERQNYIDSLLELWKSKKKHTPEQPKTDWRNLVYHGLQNRNATSAQVQLGPVHQPNWRNFSNQQPNSDRSQSQFSRDQSNMNVLVSSWQQNTSNTDINPSLNNRQRAFNRNAQRNTFDPSCTQGHVNGPWRRNRNCEKRKLTHDEPTNPAKTSKSNHYTWRRAT